MTALGVIQRYCAVCRRYYPKAEIEGHMATHSPTLLAALLVAKGCYLRQGAVYRKVEGRVEAVSDVMKVLLE